MSDAEMGSSGASEADLYDEEDDLMEERASDDSSFEDMAFEQGEAASKAQRKPYQVDFRCLSVQDIEDRQKQDAEHVAGVLALQPTEAIILLRHWAWKKDRLIEAYMDSPDKCKVEAGLETGRQPRLKRMRGFLCEVCYDESAQETIALTCNHRYCRDCYTSYLNQKITDGESKRIQCMESKCALVVDERTVELLVDADTAEKYKRLLNRAFVDDNPSLRWCPGTDCTYALECHVPVKSLDSTVPTVTCDAGHSFCFGCAGDDHQPCICPLVKRWLKKCADDSETANWISANTKECPKCQATIEKNGGCNHMTCKKCRYEYCWVCMGVWSDHGTSWYSCNRFDGSKDVGKDSQSKSRASLERYLHYFTRYDNHMQSSKLEQDLYGRIERKMLEVQTSSKLSWIECQFLKKAVDTLSVCRNTLRWTYAFAFYLQRDNETELFEQNQSDLEMAVEALSELIEKPVEAETVANLRAEVLNRSVYVEKRNEIMLKDTLEGLGESRWAFTVDT